MSFLKNHTWLVHSSTQRICYHRTNPCRITRGVTRGDCIIPSRKSAFSQSAFSVTTSQEWNNIPTCIRDLNTYRSFSSNLKQWFIENMTCVLCQCVCDFVLLAQVVHVVCSYVLFFFFFFYLVSFFLFVLFCFVFVFVRL